MKKVIKMLFLFSLFCGIYTNTLGLEIDFTFDIGTKGGTTNELADKEEKLISRLDWNDRIIPTVGFTGQAAMNNFLLRLGITFVIPVKNGTMEDYDYLIPDSREPSQYSWHDVYMDKDFTCSIEGGYSFIIFNWYITPTIGFQYRNKKWTATDGYLQYPMIGHWTGDESKIKLDGSVISYEQAVWFPFAALEVGYNYRMPYESILRVAINGGIYPYIRAETNDTHFLRSIQFYDSLRGGIGWNLGLSVGFFPGFVNRAGFIINFGYEGVSNVKGASASKNIGVSSGSLIVNEGYGGKIDSSQWHIKMSIFIPVYSK